MSPLASSSNWLRNENAEGVRVRSSLISFFMRHFLVNGFGSRLRSRARPCWLAAFGPYAKEMDTQSAAFGTSGDHRYGLDSRSRVFEASANDCSGLSRARDAASAW
jgi:hypothetical protein